MIYTSRIKKALQFAARKHQSHFRAENPPLPYITHLVSAMLIASAYTEDEDILIATLLHDTLEDTDTTEEELLKEFGSEVARIVRAVTDPKEKVLSWEEGKRAYLASVEAGGEKALLVSAVDKIDNIESKIEAVEREGQAFIARFKTPQTAYLWYHGEVLKLVEAARLPEDLKERFRQVHTGERACIASL